jgi:hypothetical protein
VDTQVVVAAVTTVPTIVAVLIGILNNNSRLNDMNVRLSELRTHIDARFTDMDRKFTDMDRKMDQRFDDAKDTWRAELHRVEEVLNARLQHLEQH